MLVGAFDQGMHSDVTSTHSSCRNPVSGDITKFVVETVKSERKMVMDEYLIAAGEKAPPPIRDTLLVCCERTCEWLGRTILYLRVS